MEDSIEEGSFSENEAVCVDDEVFFGPMTAKEKMIKKRFERMLQKEGPYMPPQWSDFKEPENKPSQDIEITVDSSESSIYKSFSNEESKYESFNDSLNDGLEENRQEINASQFLLEQVNVNCLRSGFKQKGSSHYYCDSLEDIHSLVSSMERFSVSEEIEGINILEKSAACDDSLRNDVCKGNEISLNEQCFDDDSLAIMEYEKNFDDSLDESNVPSLNHTDSLIVSRNKDDNDLSLAAKHSFRIIYENVANSSDGSDNFFDKGEADIISDSKSDDVSRDSLDEIREMSKQSSAKNECGDFGKKCKDDFRRSSKFGKAALDVDEFEDSIGSSQSRLLNTSPELSNKQENASIDDSVVILSNLNMKAAYSLNTTENKLFFHSNEFVCQDTVDESSAPALTTTIPKSLVSLKTNNRIFIKDSIIPSPDTATCTGSTWDKASVKIVNSDISSVQNCHDSIYIDNSTIQSPHKIICVDSNQDKNLIESKSPFLEMPTVQSINDTIYIDDSVIQSPDTITCVHSNLDRNLIEMKSPFLEMPTVQSTNDTIYIDDSVIQSPDVCVDSNLNKKLIKNEKNISFVETPIEQSTNNIIYINDSVIESLNADLGTGPKGDNNSSKFETVQNFNDTICIEDSILQPPLSDKTFSRSPLKPLNVSKSNQTILIDDSLVLSPDFDLNHIPITTEIQDKSSELDDSFEARIKKVSLNGKYKRLSVNSPTPVIGLCSSKDDFSSINSQSTINEILKKGITQHLLTTNDNLVSSLSTPEQKLKLHVEVEIEENQGVNIISISSVKKVDQEQVSSPNLEASIRMNLNFGSEVKKNLDVEKKQTSKVKETLSGGGKNLNLALNSFSPNKFSDDLHIKLGMQNAKLLQALDLHDTSFNYVEDGNLQSRDSIMPLNLCTRDKSLRNKNMSFFRNESKENIPFDSTHSKDLMPNCSRPNFTKTPTSSPLMNTNKVSNQLNTKPEVKNSDGRTNSATKIPIRKMDNAVLPPILNQKSSKQGSTKQNKAIKAPTYVISKKVCEETPKKHMHHFCLVRNSISKVPKSIQKPSSKKFQNIQSPIAQYIGNTPCIPSKTIAHCDGNNLVTNMGPPSQFTASHGLQEIATTQKVNKK